VLAVVADEADELAAAWAQARAFGEQLAELHTRERAAHRETAAGRRALDAQKKRFEWMNATNEDLRWRLARLEQERSAAADERDAFREENAALRRELEFALRSQASESSRVSPEPRGDNRAQRRRAAKDARRRGD
jgi:hypothetical protein